jgi:hypothetical protein
MLNRAVVIAGLDPAIHLLEWMDARVKPAHDDEIGQIDRYPL